MSSLRGLLEGEEYLLELDLDPYNKEGVEQSLIAWSYNYGGLLEGNGSFDTRHIDKGQYTENIETGEPFWEFVPGFSWLGPNEQYDWARNRNFTLLNDPGITTLEKATRNPQLTNFLDEVVVVDQDRLSWIVTEAVVEGRQNRKDVTLFVGPPNGKEYREGLEEGVMFSSQSKERGGETIPARIVIKELH